MPMAEKIARAIAASAGDDYESAHRDKAAWDAANGNTLSGGWRASFMPLRCHYDDAARAALTALLEPTEPMRIAAVNHQLGNGPLYEELWQTMIQAALAS